MPPIYLGSMQIANKLLVLFKRIFHFKQNLQQKWILVVCGKGVDKNFQVQSQNFGKNRTLEIHSNLQKNSTPCSIFGKVGKPLPMFYLRECLFSTFLSYLPHKNIHWRSNKRVFHRNVKSTKHVQTSLPEKQKFSEPLNQHLRILEPRKRFESTKTA